jgi:hypothetical protein
MAELEKVVEHIASSGDVWFARLDQVAEHAAPTLNVTS